MCCLLPMLLSWLQQGIEEQLLCLQRRKNNVELFVVVKLCRQTRTSMPPSPMSLLPAAVVSCNSLLKPRSNAALSTLVSSLRRYLSLMQSTRVSMFCQASCMRRSDSAERKHVTTNLIRGFPCSFQVFSFVGQRKKISRKEAARKINPPQRLRPSWSTPFIEFKANSFARNLFLL